MSETPPTPPPPSDDLSPQEEAKFSKFLARVLAEEDASKPPTQQPPPHTPPPNPPPTMPVANGGGDLRTQIRGILDERDKEKDRDSTISSLKQEVETLKKGQPRKRPWWSPLIG